MPSFLEQQIQGKYKGIPFLTRSESLNNVGQSRVVHRYPKTKVQYAEPMGEEPFDATIEIFFSGVDYIGDFERFKRACQDPAPGRLFMPTFGVFNDIVTDPFTVSASQKSLGEISVSVHFYTTTDRPSPIEANISEEDVSEQAQAARQALLSTIEEDYPVPTSLNNVEVASSAAKSLGNTIDTITKKSRLVRSYIRKVDQNIRNAQRYAALLLNPGQPQGFLQSLVLSISRFSGFSLYRQIANMGKTIPNSMNDIRDGITPLQSTIVPQSPGNGELDVNINLWPDDTAERRERNQIQLVNILSFRIIGLIGMFESAAAQDYSTTEDIDKTQSDLEQYYLALVENSEYDVIIPSMRNTLDNLKNLTYAVLAIKRQQAYTVIEIKIVRPMSAWLLAYELYGEYLKNETAHNYMAELITGLNRSQPAHRLQGTVKVVEIGS